MDYVRIECVECNCALRVSDEGLLSGLQPGELFEENCPKCEKPVYFRLPD